MKPRKMEKQKLSRAQILTIFFAIIFAVFLIRLFFIQIISHEKYAAEATEMQTTKQTINAARGEIFVRDADGKLAPLVLNQTVYTLFADATQISDAEKVKNLVNKVAGGEVLAENLAKITDKKSQYLVLAKNISVAQANEIKKENLAGIGLQAGSRRVYPEGNLAAQILGFVNSDGKGQYGAEQFLNSRLAGKNGLLQAITDVRRIPLTIGANDVSIPAKNGENLVLAIDRNVQSQAEQILAEGLTNSRASSGSIIIMNPENGRVLAAASLPSYNPEDLNSIKINENQGVSTAEILPITNAYEPGSVMKLFTVGAGMDAGVIARNSTFNNTNCINVDDAKICNVENVAGTRTMMEILEYSLNTGAVFVLKQMGGGDINLAGRQIFYNYLTKNYRLNAPTGIEVAGESDSVIYPPDMTAGPRVTYANMAFGQGEQLTMIQVISAFSAAINGGNYYQPTILLGTADETGENLTENTPKLTQQNVLKPEVSANLKEMLQQARFLGAGGKTKDNGYFVGGKSGTAQKIDPKTGKYSDDLTTGTYLGFGADAQKTPKYAIMVRVDDAKNGGFSGSAAAQPIFDKMSNFMIQYEGISK